MYMYAFERNSTLEKYAWTVIYFSRDGVYKKNLNKLLFFADFCYSSMNGNKNDMSITGDVYKKIQYGPIPSSIEEIRNILVSDEYLKKEEKRVFTTVEGYYKINLPFERIKQNILDDTEMKAVTLVYDKLIDKDSSFLSTFSHMIEPWKSSEYGDTLLPEKMNNDPIYEKYKLKSLYELLESDIYDHIVTEKIYEPVSEWLKH